jgi:hypothetical protein
VVNSKYSNGPRVRLHEWSFRSWPGNVCFAGKILKWINSSGG